MPRPERPLELDGSTLTEFAADLRILREKAGSPPYRDLARRAHFSSTTLSDAAGGRRLPSLAVTLAYVEACDGDRDDWERRWRSVATELSADTTPFDADEEHGAPYVGLRAYGPADVELFFGRERLVSDLVKRVDKQRFLAVFGPSGCGKSSVLRAGLVPVLNKRPGKVVVFSPGARPLDELALRLADMLGTTAPSVAPHLDGDPETVDSLFRQIVLSDEPGATVTLVIDQFEEVFTLCTDKEERSRFVDLLLGVAARGAHCRIVLGVRADFYSHCALQPGLADALQDAQVTVGPMTAEDVRQVIVRPAAASDCAVESALLTALVAHAHGQSGVLPLLSHALLETWRRRKGNTLTLAGFEAAGGLEGALSRTAETVFSSLTVGQQNVAQQLFRRLTALGEGTADTKRPVDLPELDDDADTATVIEKLTRARLLVVGQNTAELAHEAIIDAWPRLRGWLNADRDGQRIHRELSDATTTWDAHNRDTGTLLRGARLTLISEWATSRRSALTTKERTFLDASLHADAAEHTAARRRSRRQRTLIAVLSVLLLVAVATTTYAVRAQQSAASQRDIALSRQAISDIEGLLTTDPVLAVQLSLVANRLEPSAATRSHVIAAAAAASPSPVGGDEMRAKISRNANIIAVPSQKDDNATLWTFTGARPVVAGVIQGSPTSISGDGRTVVTVDKNKKLQVWDVADPMHPAVIVTLPTLASGGAVDVQRRYLISEGAQQLQLPQSGPGDSGSYAIPANEITLWDLGDTRNPRMMGNVKLKGQDFELRDDASIIVGVSAEEETGYAVQVWRPQSIDTPGVALRVPGKLEYGFVMSPDGRTVVTNAPSSPTETVLLLWDLVDATHPRYVGKVDIGSTSSTARLAFSQDSTRLAVLPDGGGNLDIWNIADRANAVRDMTIVTPSRIFSDLVFSSDGKTLTAAGGKMESSVEIWRWNLDAKVAVSDICRQSPPPSISREQWADHFPELPYKPPCG